jgi:hypothetical protein
MNLKENFVRHLCAKYPGLREEILAPLISENLLSPFHVELPKAVLSEAERIVAALFRLKENPHYQASYSEELKQKDLMDPKNKSICMSYDFHVTDEGRLKLIEVNTNASFLALGYEMYQMHGAALPQADFSLEELRTNIETELLLQGKGPGAGATSKGLKVSIIDEHPSVQRLYSEFLLFSEMFKAWGWNSVIQDVRDVDFDQTDFIYNRYTDFYLEAAESQSLKKAFLSGKICLSPNPFEYALLADKQRLIDWRQESALDRWHVSEVDKAAIESSVPQSLVVAESRSEELWAQRKKYFFKPLRAYGAKQSYRGASITNKAFASLVGKDFIAQEFVPPQQVTYDHETGPITFKYDLRCYAYQGRLQLVLARLYQGQVTNLKTPLGGFACVVFK